MKTQRRKRVYARNYDTARWYTAREAEVMLGISRRTLSDWIRDGKFMVYRPSANRVLLLREDVEQYVAAHTVPARSGRRK